VDSAVLAAEWLVRRNPARDQPIAILVQYVDFGVFEDSLGSLVPPDDAFIDIHNIHTVARVAECVQIFSFTHEPHSQISTGS
jgi:hypothetical protein